MSFRLLAGSHAISHRHLILILRAYTECLFGTRIAGTSTRSRWARIFSTVSSMRVCGGCLWQTVQQRKWDVRQIAPSEQLLPDRLQAVSGRLTRVDQLWL